MKKLTYILICALLAVVLAVTAFATDAAEMTLDTEQKTVVPGETAVFTVTLSAMEDCSSAGFTLSYDEAVFEFLDGSCSLKNTMLASVKDGVGVFTYGKTVAVSGEIFSFRLKVKDSAATGSYTITAKGSVRDGAGAVSTKVNGITLAVGVETDVDATEPTVTETVPQKGTEPAPDETLPEKQTEPTEPETTAPTQDTDPVSHETDPGSDTQPTATETPVHTVDIETIDPRGGFPWWSLAVAAGIAVAIAGISIWCRKKK